MSAPAAKLGGVPLMLGESQIQWDLTYGTSPLIREFVLSRERADAVLAKAPGPMTLTIGSEVYGHIYVMSSGPGNDQATRGVVCMDRRWLWRRRIVTGAYNVRRRSGETRMVGEGAVQTRPLVDNERYATWSLNGSSAWEPKEVLVDVLSQVGVEDPLIPEITRRIEVEDLDWTSQPVTGTRGVAEAMSYFGGYKLTLAPSGRVIVRDVLAREEDRAVAEATSTWDNTGWVEVVDRSPLRPGKVEVYLEREVELRLDHAEDESTQQGSVTAASSEIPERELIAVMPCPDTTLDLPDGRTVTRGTWITQEDFLAAKRGTWLRNDLTKDLARDLYMVPSSLITTLSQDAGQTDLQLARGAATFMQHFRRTFRIPPAWMERIRSVRAYRVGIVDAETAVRGPSQAWMDYSRVPTTRGMALNRRRSQGNNREDWAVEGYADLLADGETAEAIVRVEDEEAGIISVTLATDPRGLEATMVPGLFKETPSLTPGARALTASAPATWRQLKLQSGWQMAVVLTVVQAAPHGKGRMHVEERTARDVQDILGVELGPSKGPTWETKIQATRTTMARYLWLDRHATEVEEVFVDGGQLPEEMLVNGNVVSALADAAAARIYASLLDRQEGRMVTSQVAGITPAGSLATVRQGIASDGTAFTSWELPPVLKPADLRGFLPMAERRLIQRVVQPG